MLSLRSLYIIKLILFHAFIASLLTCPLVPYSLKAGLNFQVIQADTPDSDSMIPLKPGGLQEEERYTDSGNYSEPVYETIPPYSIPANFPDVKVSVL